MTEKIKRNTSIQYRTWSIKVLISYESEVIQYYKISYLFNSQYCQHFDLSLAYTFHYWFSKLLYFKLGPIKSMHPYQHSPSKTYPSMVTPNLLPQIIPKSHLSDTQNTYFFNELKKLLQTSVDIKTQNMELQKMSVFLKDRLEKIEKEITDLGRTQEKVGYVEREENDEKEKKKPKRYRRTNQMIEKCFQCQFEKCDKSYASQGSLQQHIKLKHNMNVQGSQLNRGMQNVGQSDSSQNQQLSCQIKKREVQNLNSILKLIQKERESENKQLQEYMKWKHGNKNEKTQLKNRKYHTAAMKEIEPKPRTKSNNINNDSRSYINQRKQQGQNFPDKCRQLGKEGSNYEPEMRKQT